MEDQVLSRDQMQELKELDIDTNYGSMYWHNYNTDSDPQWELCSSADVGDITTFTLQDILEMLPSYSITYDKYTNGLDKYEIKVDIPENQHYITHIARSSKSLLKAAFKMLKWCKQYNFI